MDNFSILYYSFFANKLFCIGVIVVSLLALIFSADRFTLSVEIIGEKKGISSFSQGAIIIAICTSMPELVTSIFSVLAKSSEMVISNILGTVIANTLLAIGLAAIFVKKKKILNFNEPVLNIIFPIFLCSLLIVYFTIYDKTVSRLDAVIYLIGAIIYLKYRISCLGKERVAIKEHPESYFKLISELAVFLALITVSSKMLVDAIIGLTKVLNVSTTQLSATIIAVGSSFPEISVAIVDARKGKYDRLIGNILGSNVFDLLSIIGICALISPLKVTQLSLYFIYPFAVGTLVLFWNIIIDNKVSKPEASFMLLLYLLFIMGLFTKPL